MRRWVIAMVSKAVAVAYNMARYILRYVHEVHLQVLAAIPWASMFRCCKPLLVITNYRIQTRAFGRSATYRHFTLGLLVAVKAHGGYGVASNRNDSRMNHLTSWWPSHFSQLASTKKGREKRIWYTKVLYIRLCFQLSMLSRKDRQTDRRPFLARTYISIASNLKIKTLLLKSFTQLNYILTFQTSPSQPWPKNTAC